VAFYLGIDGGGSKTASAVGDESNLIATATAGPSNIVRVGETAARESLHQAVRQACAAAGITPQQIRRACVGAAGAGRPETASIVHRILAEILPEEGEIHVVGDGPIALEAAFSAGPGVIVIAGTGSISYGRDAKGRTARAGGWGFAISDEGSAHWIGRAAIAALVRAKGAQACDESDSVLWPLITKLWNTNSFEDLIRIANASPPPDFAAIFPAVLAAAEQGDTMSLGILQHAGRELADLAASVIHQLFPRDESTRTTSIQSADSEYTVPVAMAGGVFRHASTVRQTFYNEVRNACPEAKLNPQVVDPVLGALQLARRGEKRAALE
jgi:N-acetylglucosamine kinase-like BadF-type ATPase